MNHCCCEYPSPCVCSCPSPEPVQISATATANAFALTTTNNIVTATATATATGTTYEEAYMSANYQAKTVAQITAQNDANIISQTIEIIETPLKMENTSHGEKAFYKWKTSEEANTGSSNSAFGYNSLYSDLDGHGNTAIGANSLYTNKAFYNTATGYQSLYSNTMGNNNNGYGVQSLYYNTTGTNNVAIGNDSLYNNITGDNNTAIGYQSLYNHGSKDNTACGYQALYSNTTGVENNAYGIQALFSNTVGSENVAMGSISLYSNVSGTNNVSIGNGTLYLNEIGNGNTAIGDIALHSNVSNSNTAIGKGALFSNISGTRNSAVGFKTFESNINGTDNTVIGYMGGAGSFTQFTDVGCTLIGTNTSFSSNRPSNTVRSTAIGYGATILDSNTIYLGTSNEVTVAVGGLTVPTGEDTLVFTLTANSLITANNGIIVRNQVIRADAGIIVPSGQNTILNNQYINKALHVLPSSLVDLSINTSYATYSIHASSVNIKLPIINSNNVGITFTFRFVETPFTTATVNFNVPDIIINPIYDGSNQILIESGIPGSRVASAIINTPLTTLTALAKDYDPDTQVYTYAWYLSAVKI